MEINKYKKLFFVALCITASSYCAFGQPKVGKLPLEDLSDCKLQNGIQELPKKGSTKSIEYNGYIFKFNTKKLEIDPLTKQDKDVRSFKELRDVILKEKTGDIYFDSVESHGLIAMSSRIKNLGKHYLYEFNGVKMSVPEEVFFTEEGETAPGILININLGECFLMTTLDGELVLLRLIGVDNDRMCGTIQWIKAELGSRTFKIPKGQLIQPEPEKSEVDQIQIQQDLAYQKKIALQLEYWKEQEKLSKAIEIHLSNRKKVIQTLLDILKGSEGVDANNVPKVITDLNKDMAVRALGELRATEGLDLITSRIHILSQGVSRETTIDGSYPCVPALTKIGKPGAAACLKEIVNLTQSDWEDPFKAKLLLLVILRVEGEKFTRQILEDFKESLKDEKQIKNIEKAISLIDEAKVLSGPIEDIYSQLKHELLKANEII